MIFKKPHSNTSKLSFEIFLVSSNSPPNIISQNNNVSINVNKDPSSSTIDGNSNDRQSEISSNKNNNNASIDVTKHKQVNHKQMGTSFGLVPP